MDLCRIAIAAIVALLLALLLVQWLVGGELGVQREMYGSRNPYLMKAHIAVAIGLAVFTVVTVLLVEHEVRASPDPYGMNLWLFGFHLLCDLGAVSIFALMVTKYTGKKDRRWHGRLARALSVVLFGMVGTGIVLLIGLPI